jgi:excisionase family DNA binding protein
MPDKPAYSDDDMLTVAEAADFLDVHASTIRRWADAGGLPTFRTPTNHRRFRVDDLRKAIAAEQQPAESAPASGSEVA